MKSFVYTFSSEHFLLGFIDLGTLCSWNQGDKFSKIFHTLIGTVFELFQFEGKRYVCHGPPGLKQWWAQNKAPVITIRWVDEHTRGKEAGRTREVRDSLNVTQLTAELAWKLTSHNSQSSNLLTHTEGISRARVDLLSGTQQKWSRQSRAMWE